MRSGKKNILGLLLGQTIEKVRNNSLLAFFKIAINGGYSIFNMQDGFIDEYEDETGIDTGASTDESYDSTNDLYSPLFGGGSIDEDTVLMLHLNNNVTDDGNGSVTGGHTVTNSNVTFDAGTKKWGSHSGVFNGSTAYLSVPDSIDWDIVGSNSDNWTIDFWVKMTDHAGEDVYIAQIEPAYPASINGWELYHAHGSGIKFLASTNDVGIISTPFGGEITDSNWHHIALIKVGSKYAIYKDGTQVNYVNDSSTDTYAGDLYIGVPIPANPYNKWWSGYMDEIRIQHSNIFEANPNDIPNDTIDIPTEEYSAPSGGNMTLISNSQTAEAVPSNARIVLFEEDVDAITVNTDLKAYVSRDGGTTWTQVTLADEGDYDTSKRILAGSVDISGQPSGTNIEYKITTLNEKDLKLHGTGVLWDA